jgi:hypothetical protein
MSRGKGHGQRKFAMHTVAALHRQPAWPGAIGTACWPPRHHEACQSGFHRSRLCKLVAACVISLVAARAHPLA